MRIEDQHEERRRGKRASSILPHSRLSSAREHDDKKSTRGNAMGRMPRGVGHDRDATRATAPNEPHDGDL